jgi:hypothetical protein
MDVSEFIPVEDDLTELALPELFSELLQWLQLLSKSYTDVDLQSQAASDLELESFLKHITSNIQLAVNIIKKTRHATKQYSLLSQKILDQEPRYKRIKTDQSAPVYSGTWNQLTILHGLREVYRHYMCVHCERMTSTCTMIDMLNDFFLANYAGHSQV